MTYNKKLSYRQQVARSIT